LRLFATSNEASAFARQMIGASWRVEVGDLDEMEPEAPGAFIAARSLAAALAPSQSAAVARRYGRA